jgi:hypothetical protein
MSTGPANSRSRWTADLTRVNVQLFSVAVVLMSASCADELHRDKPGVDSATLDEDLKQCTQRARLDARQQELPDFGSPLAIRADPQGNPVVVPSTTRDTDRFLAEQDLTGACMRSKGYQLVPGKQ